ncbi:nucleotide-binding universal stress UspA family protein [Arthrobacter sp. 1088]|nr:nucleotide-binding universal stress UspA family protein [Arthrobacter sp. 1088]
MSGTILVGVDGSKTARRAAESARDIAAASRPAFMSSHPSTQTARK